MHHFERQVDRGIEAQDGDSPRGLLKAVRASAIGSGMKRVYNSGHESIFSHLPGSLWVLDPDVRYPSHSYLMMVRDKKRMMILRIGYRERAGPHSTFRCLWGS